MPCTRTPPDLPDSFQICEKTSFCEQINFPVCLQFFSAFFGPIGHGGVYFAFLSREGFRQSPRKHFVIHGKFMGNPWKFKWNNHGKTMDNSMENAWKIHGKSMDNEKGKKDMFPWYSMGSHGGPSGPMCPHEESWVPMGFHGSPWVPMGPVLWVQFFGPSGHRLLNESRGRQEDSHI